MKLLLLSLILASGCVRQHIPKDRDVSDLFLEAEKLKQAGKPVQAAEVYKRAEQLKRKTEEDFIRNDSSSIPTVYIPATYEGDR